MARQLNITALQNLASGKRKEKKIMQLFKWRKKRQPEEVPEQKFFQNAQAWIGDDKNNPFDFSNQLSGQTPDDVRNLTEKTTKSVRKTVRKNVRGREWQWKAARNAEFMTPVLGIKWILPFVMAVAAGVLFADGQPPIICLLAVQVDVIAFLLCNPFFMIGRILSREARWLISADMVLAIIMMLARPNQRAVMAASVWTVLSLLVVAAMNRQWLAAYNWYNSERVRMALVKAPDNHGMISWKDTGKRESRTALAEMGLEYSDDVLQMYAFPCYMIGFWSAFRKTDTAERKAEKAEADLLEQQEKHEKDMEAWKEKNRKLQDLSDGYKSDAVYLEDQLAAVKDGYEEQLSYYKPYMTMYRQAMDEVKELQDEIEALKSVREENQRLRIANEQLIAEAVNTGAISNPEEVPDVPEDDIESKVISLLQIKDEKGNRKYSYAKISQMLDGEVGKTKVGVIANKLKEKERREAS